MDEKKTAYETLVELCVQSGILPKAEMNEQQLRIILSWILRGGVGRGNV